MRPSKEIRLAACFIILLLLSGSSCPPPQPTSLPANKPVLQAVFRPGTKPMLVPHDLGGEYEVLPAASIIIRLAPPWPNYPGGLEVTLGGADVQEVGSNDYQKQTQLSTAGLGFYIVEMTSSSFDVYAVPPPAKRQGPRVAIQIINHAINPAPGQPTVSDPLTISAITAAAKTIIEPSDVFFDCGGGQYNDEDTNLAGEWFYDCKPSSSIVARNVVLAGWLDSAPSVSCPSRCVEDIHYVLRLDPDFISQLYDDPTFDTPLTGAVLPGHLTTGGPSATTLPFQDISEIDGSSRGIDLNSFIIPNQADIADFYIQVELNCWHVLGTNDLFTRNWAKRGPAPAGWFNKAFGDGHTTDGDCWWAYAPDKPDKSASAPQAGTYVRMKGTIWMDFFHPGSTAWEAIKPGMGGWLEMHPPDWIEVVPSPPSPTKTVQMVSLALSGIGSPLAATKDITIAPPGPQPSGKSLQYREIIDGRFTDMATVDAHSVTKFADHISVHVQVHQTVLNPNSPHTIRWVPGYFKAVYVVWWE